MTKELLSLEGEIGARDVLDGVEQRCRRPRSAASRGRAKRSGRRASRTGGGARPGAGRAPAPAAVLGEYKLAVLREADACSRPGELGALLRREGLYTSHLTYWRKQRDEGALKGLSRPRGRKPTDRRDAELGALRRRAERAEVELEKARKVIEVQGNVSALLGELLEPRGAKGSTER